MDLKLELKSRSVGRVNVAHTHARLGGGEPPIRVCDVSPQGLKALVPNPMARGDTATLEILHPSLGVPITVQGEVRWARPDPAGGGTYVGISFVSLSLAARGRLSQLIALELGRRILIGGSPVGYAATGGDAEDTLFLYDSALKPRAAIHMDADKFRVERLVDVEDEAKSADAPATLEEAVRYAFDREGPVRFESSLNMNTPLPEDASPSAEVFLEEDDPGTKAS